MFVKLISNIIKVATLPIDVVESGMRKNEKILY